MAELVDALDLGSSVERRGSSSLPSCTDSESHENSERAGDSTDDTSPEYVPNMSQSPRQRLIASLLDTVRLATEAGDLATARTASSTLNTLLGDEGDEGEVVDLGHERRKRGR